MRDVFVRLYWFCSVICLIYTGYAMTEAVREVILIVALWVWDSGFY